MKLVVLLVLLVSCLSIDPEQDRKQRRYLRDHDQKVQKYEHWLKAKDLPLGEKIKDSYTRRQDYERREGQKEGRLEKWEEDKLRYDPRKEVADHHLKVEQAYKTKTLYKRRVSRHDIRKKASWEAQKAEAESQGATKEDLALLSTEELVTLLETMNIHNCGDVVRARNIDGPKLGAITIADEIVALGISIPPTAADDLFNEIQDFKIDGIPSTFIKEKADIMKHLSKKEDDSKKIYCSSGVAPNGQVMQAATNTVQEASGP